MRLLLFCSCGKNLDVKTPLYDHAQLRRLWATEHAGPGHDSINSTEFESRKGRLAHIKAGERIPRETTGS